MRLLPVSLSLLLAACAAPAVQPRPAGDARAAIMAVSRDFSSRYERGDIAGLVSLYTPDGVILPPGRATMRGVEELTRYWSLPEGFRVLEHRVTPDSIEVVGPVAYDWGTYRVRTRGADGVERENGGKYVIVWREQSPGTWRIHVDMWNAGPPAGR